jgi:hypothetical protein
MRERHDRNRKLFEDLMAGAPRRGFQSFAFPGDLDPADNERNAPLLAKPAAKGGPRVRVGTQAMVDVNRRDTRLRSQLVEEDYRIDTARQADGDCASARSLP